MTEETFHGMDAIKQRIADRTASMHPPKHKMSTPVDFTAEDAADLLRRHRGVDTEADGYITVHPQLDPKYASGEAFVDDDGEVFQEIARHFDDGKPDLSLLPQESLAEIARVLQFGAGKYGTHNWQKGMPWRKIAASCLRHVFSWLAGEDKDPESGISHIAHAGCNVMFLLWYIKNEVGTDDRQ